MTKKKTFFFSSKNKKEKEEVKEFRTNYCTLLDQMFIFRIRNSFKKDVFFEIRLFTVLTAIEFFFCSIYLKSLNYFTFFYYRKTKFNIRSITQPHQNFTKKSKNNSNKTKIAFKINILIRMKEERKIIFYYIVLCSCVFHQ